MGATTSLTFEDFEKYQDDCLKHELLEGEHIIFPAPKRPHTRVQQNLQDALRPYVREHHLGEVHIEAGFKLSPQTWLQPDVSFVRSEQIEQGDPNEYFEGAPALAIEVAPESNTAAQIDLKMELYFAHGAEEVWVVYPQTRHVRAHFPDGHSETLTTELKSALFPGWSAPLSAVFTAATA
jgi:Uma2 family endonuclease